MNLLIPSRYLQRGPLHRLAVSALTLQGEPGVLLQVWGRSRAEGDRDDAYSPTSAAVALPARDVRELVLLLEDAAREAGG